MRINSKFNPFIILLIIFLSAIGLYSQDIIILSNDRAIMAKNIVITPATVSYQAYSNSNNKNLTIPRSQVKTVSYKDGSNIILNQNEHLYNKLNLDENIISIYLLDFVISNITFSYEKIIAGGKYGIKIPLSFGYKDKTTTLYYPIPTEPDYTNELVSKFYSGASFNIYPTGQGRLRYFLGPEIRIGNGIYHNNENDYGSSSKDNLNTGYFKLLLNNGITYTPSNSFSISIIGSVGIQYMTKKEINKAQTSGALSLNLSLRF